MRSLQQYRDALRQEFGDHQYKIMRDGTIHVYGMMPNTAQEGWYLYGDVGSADTEYRLFDEAQ